MPDWRECKEQLASVCDGRSQSGEPVGGIFCSNRWAEHSDTDESCCDWISECYCARCEHGTCHLHDISEGGTDGMRKDNMGVRLVCSLPSRPRSSGKPAIDADDGTTGGKCEHSRFNGRIDDERYASKEQCHNRVG